MMSKNLKTGQRIFQPWIAAYYTSEIAGYNYINKLAERCRRTAMNDLIYLFHHQHFHRHIGGDQFKAELVMKCLR